MKKIKLRTVSVIALVALLAAGLGLFTVRFVRNGSDWVSFRSNGNVFKNGKLLVGTVTDRDGVVLASISGGKVTYAEDMSVRESALHLIGDSGNIAGGALSVFATELTGYDIINGTYSPSGAGGTVILSVSAQLNKTAYEALNGRNGAVAMMNYKTGEILCMVSSPTFDPENPPEISSDDTSGVYINRVTGASFTPGSVYKLVTLAAAIENIDDLYERDFHCDGSTVIGGGTVTCTSAHGDMKIEDALAKSCNCVFAALAVELGSEVMEEYAEKLGITEGFTIDGSNTASGRYDGAADGSIELAWSGAGQHNDLVVPISMLRYVGAVANAGTASGMTLQKGGNTKSQRIISKETAEKIADMMNYCVYLTYGEDMAPGIELCAKSGTAEVGGGASPHSWFTGFVRDEEYPVAFVVMVENGGWGYTEAGAIASKLLSAAKDIAIE